MLQDRHLRAGRQSIYGPIGAELFIHLLLSDKLLVVVHMERLAHGYDRALTMVGYISVGCSVTWTFYIIHLSMLSCTSFQTSVPINFAASNSEARKGSAVHSAAARSYARPLSQHPRISRPFTMCHLRALSDSLSFVAGTL